MLKFFRSLLPRSVEKRPMRLSWRTRSSIEIWECSNDIPNAIGCIIYIYIYMHTCLYIFTWNTAVPSARAPPPPHFNIFMTRTAIQKRITRIDIYLYTCLYIFTWNAVVSSKRAPHPPHFNIFLTHIAAFLASSTKYPFATGTTYIQLSKNWICIIE